MNVLIIILIVILVLFIFSCFCEEKLDTLTRPLDFAKELRLIEGQNLPKAVLTKNLTSVVPPPVKLTPNSITDYILANVVTGNVVFVEFSGKWYWPGQTPYYGDLFTMMTPGGVVGFARCRDPSYLCMQALNNNINNYQYVQMMAPRLSQSIPHLRKRLTQALRVEMQLGQITITVINGFTYMGKNTFKNEKLKPETVMRLSTGVGTQPIPVTNPPVNFDAVKVIDILKT